MHAYCTACARDFLPGYGGTGLPELTVWWSLELKVVSAEHACRDSISVCSIHDFPLGVKRVCILFGAGDIFTLSRTTLELISD